MQNINKIQVVPYNNLWITYFKNEAQQIENILESKLKKIHHIGSTSIPNMPAKPIIDILLECESIDDINWISEKLQALQYAPVRRQIIPHYSFFTKRDDKQIGFNLHIYERGDPQIRRHVNFKDYLIHHSNDAAAYAELKLKLANQANDIIDYVLGKNNLVQEISAKAKKWSVNKTLFLPPNTGPLAKNWSLEKITKSMEANLNVHMTHFSQYLTQTELIRVPGFTTVNSGLPDDTFNLVIDADFSAEQADKKIDEATTYFTQKNLPFSWWLSPHEKPTNLAELLENKHYQNTENNVGMYFDLDAWDANISSMPELHIVKAQDKKTLQDFALVLANDIPSFKEYFSWIASIMTNDEPIEYYVGYVNDKPVVRGLSCYYAGVAGLHWLSTAPDERKKGYGSMMQQFRLKRAKELGYHIAVLQASHEGYPLYKKLGYQECGVFKEFKLIL